MLTIVFVFPEGRGPAGEKLVSGSFELALDAYVYGACVAFILLVSRTKHLLARVLNAILGLRIFPVVAQQIE